MSDRVKYINSFEVRDERGSLLVVHHFKEGEGYGSLDEPFDAIATFPQWITETGELISPDPDAIDRRFFVIRLEGKTVERTNREPWVENPKPKLIPLLKIARSTENWDDTTEV